MKTVRSNYDIIFYSHRLEIMHFEPVAKYFTVKYSYKFIIFIPFKRKEPERFSFLLFLLTNLSILMNVENHAGRRQFDLCTVDLP